MGDASKSRMTIGTNTLACIRDRRPLLDGIFLIHDLMLFGLFLDVDSCFLLWIYTIQLLNYATYFLVITLHLSLRPSTLQDIRCECDFDLCR